MMLLEIFNKKPTYLTLAILMDPVLNSLSCKVNISQQLKDSVNDPIKISLVAKI